jgi:NAD(P)-dependent dehydrogenase (short-subunit alcohol dehydrogenase family)
MARDRTLEGQYALITGASRGVGRAVAECFAEAGCSVAVAARGAAISSVAKEIGEKWRVPCLGLCADVAQQESVHRLFEAIRSWSADRLEILVNNAGYSFSREIWDTPLDAVPADRLKAWFSDIFQTDTMGSVFCTYEALPMMMVRKCGSIIYIASTPALEGFQGTPYTVAKAGVLGLMKDVARLYGHLNIRANALALGNIRTAATLANLDPGMQSRLAEETPLRRWGETEEVARAALFLASNRSSFITGQTIAVDGGTVRR